MGPANALCITVDDIVLQIVNISCKIKRKSKQKSNLSFRLLAYLFWGSYDFYDASLFNNSYAYVYDYSIVIAVLVLFMMACLSDHGDIVLDYHGD